MPAEYLTPDPSTEEFRQEEREPSPLPPVQYLLDEDEELLAPEIIATREQLAGHIMALPDEVLSRMLIFQPSVGCLNRCSFCSQGAGTEVRYLGVDSLRDVFSALKTVAQAKDIDSLGEARDHKPGVIFPYLDNDSMSYPHLDSFIQHAGEELDTRVRLSSVTYSRHNPGLQAMHERIATELSDHVDGVRFSWTPFTYAWAVDDDRRGVSADEYTRDFANALATYRPLLDTKGPGRDTCCIEMRFKPCSGTLERGLEMTPLDNSQLLIDAGPYKVITIEDVDNLAERSHITKLDRSRPVLSNEGTLAIVIAGDERTDVAGHQQQLIDAHEEGLIGEDYRPITVNGEQVLARAGRLYRFTNEDGDYFAIDPYQLENGQFHALHLYPKTEKRPGAGFLDATRFAMNAIIDTKQDLGYGPKDSLPHATEDDIQRVVAKLQLKLQACQAVPHLADHLQANIAPMVEGLARAFGYANLPPAYFFERHFVVDTGQIVNQGRAYNAYFKYLASRSDLPLTPNEEKGYGEALSQSVSRGRTWALSFASPETRTAAAVQGVKSQLGVLALNRGSGLVFREWDPVLFDNRDSQGRPLALHFVPADLSVAHINSRDGLASYHLPGVITNG